jgi:hypothetical protein
MVNKKFKYYMHVVHFSLFFFIFSISDLNFTFAYMFWLLIYFFDFDEIRFLGILFQFLGIFTDLICQVSWNLCVFVL